MMFLSLSFFAFSMAMEARAQQEELGIYEKLDQYIPDDLTFVSERYDTVNLKAVIDKPTVLVPVYYDCPGICTPLLEGVAAAVPFQIVVNSCPEGLVTQHRAVKLMLGKPAQFIGDHVGREQSKRAFVLVNVPRRDLIIVFVAT